MATENPMRIMSSGNGMRGGIPLSESMRNSSGNGINSSGQEGVAQEIGMLLRNHSRMDNTYKWKDMVPNRSGSAPPSIEGSLASIGSFLPSSAMPGAQVASSGSAGGASVIDSEQELRSDPAYLAYYYSHVNLNPRLPPPIISRKNYFLAQRLASSGFGDKRKLSSFDDSNNRSLFSAQPVLPTHNEESEANEEDEKSPLGNLLRQASDNWGPDALSGNALGAFGARPKSLVDLIQQDFPRTPSPVYSQTRAGRTVNEEGADGGTSDLENSTGDINIPLLNSSNPMPNLPISSQSKTPTPTMNSVLPNHNTCNVNASSGSLPGALGPITRIPTPDPMISGESFANEMSSLRTSAMRGASMGDVSGATEAAKLTAALQGLSFSSKHPVASVETQDSPVATFDSSQLKEAQEDPQMKILEQPGHKSQKTQVQSQNAQYGAFPKTFQRQHPVAGLEHAYRTQEKQSLAAHSLNTNAGSAYAAAAAYMSGGNANFANLQVPNNMYPSQFGVGGYSINPNLNPSVAYDSAAAAAAAAAAVAAGMGARSSPPGLDMHQLYKNTGMPHSQITDPLLLHYLQQRSLEDAQASLGSIDSSLLRGYLGDPLELQKHKSMYPADYLSQLSRSGSLGGKLGNKTSALNPGYYGSPPGGFVMPYGNSSLQSGVLPDSPIIPGALSLRHGSRGSAAAAVYGGWQGHRASDTSEDFKGSSLLEELKNSKTRRFELIDISGHVVEFSVDQHGSRFIQQKLEVASGEEKTLVFEEVLPRALTLMTDVFGNYVIQKFFEHGSTEQRSELASQLIGHVLDLSLQMYGCRVIQKALEVVNLEQQIRIVSELEGHVMRCVRDQNGNHVIQKCIECVPTEHIQFIISACYGQVVMLSTHPYGCRVIQRVLEHCTDEQKQSGIIEDILRSTCELALDQYGNYVVQHVLEHGKPNEKCEIMKKLAGQIVQMSQHKFASNVVEKCLEYGGPNERQILISEMLGHTDENEPLQAMMKDQYANYVVQKVLETCDDQQRELLLSRIRVHLHALKKYTYGKHIVARVEKLLAAGERRGAQTAA